MASGGNAGWRLRAGSLWADAWRWSLFAGGVAFAVYLLLDRGIPNGAVAAAAVACLTVAAVLTAAEPMAIALMATPALLVTDRMGLGGVDLTVSDVALAAAFGAVILLGKHDYSPPMRALLWANLLYQFATVFTVIINPFPQNTVEWVHAWMLISGSLIVGWALGRAGKARLAFLLLLGGIGVIALGTFTTAIGQFLQGDVFAPVYPNWPWAMHKNFAGSAVALGALIAYVRPPWAQLPKRWMTFAFWTFLVALLLTQSRQAAIGLAVGLLIYIARQRGARNVALIIAIIVPGVILVVQSVIDQVDSQNQFNSFYQRVDWLREVYALWKLSPIVGHGLRYWYVQPWAAFQPPQAEVEVLASAGVVGLLGFVIMWLVILVVLWRVDPRFGMLAVGVAAARIVQAQFDLFWVAAQVSLPFLVVGICLGAQQLARSESSDPPSYWREPRERRTRRRGASVPSRAMVRAGLADDVAAYDRAKGGN